MGEKLQLSRHRLLCSFKEETELNPVVVVEDGPNGKVRELAAAACSSVWSTFLSIKAAAEMRFFVTSRTESVYPAVV